jgi:hypothetical protein
MNLILLSFHTIIRFPYSKVNIYIYIYIWLITFLFFFCFHLRMSQFLIGSLQLKRVMRWEDVQTFVFKT